MELNKLLGKIQAIRCTLQSKNLKKSGKNKFAGFNYYELHDILPSINEECGKNRICTLFNITSENELQYATLEIKDGDSKESIVFKIPFMLPGIKGANAVQNLGGALTYLRRYLLLIAFEITEHDTFDAVIGKDPAPTPVKKKVIAAKKSTYPAAVYGFCEFCDGYLHKSKSGTNLYCENFREDDGLDWDEKKHDFIKNFDPVKYPMLPENIRSGQNSKENAKQWYFEQKNDMSKTDDIPDF